MAVLSADGASGDVVPAWTFTPMGHARTQGYVAAFDLDQRPQDMQGR
ncbi:hypothetical protein [Indioceanicola profundi]|nr:hypothetical protein [Indioceanicola profundi]